MAAKRWFTIVGFDFLPSRRVHGGTINSERLMTWRPDTEVDVDRIALIDIVHFPLTRGVPAHAVATLYAAPHRDGFCVGSHRTLCTVDFA